MKTETPKVDFGVYIDRKQSFIFALNHFAHGELLSSETEKNESIAPRTTKVYRQEMHLQNEKNEQLRKFCKSVVARLEHAQHILIFGPSTSKYELQKELKNKKDLKFVKEALQTTKTMTKDEAQHFVLEFYA